MRVVLIFLAIFLTLYPLAGSSLSITYSDVLFCVLISIFIFDFINGRLYIDDFARSFIPFLFILLISGLVNLTFVEGPFLNVFKTYLFSFILYILVYSYIITTPNFLKTFMIALVILLLSFLFKTWTEMQATMNTLEVDFTNVGLFESSLNLNAWGFILVLFLNFSLYCMINKYYSKLSVIITAIIIIFIFFSFSRTAYSLTLFSVIWSFFYVGKKSIKVFITPIILIAAITVSWFILDFKVSDGSLDFLTNKTSSYQDDLVDTRFYTINIEPILHFYNTFKPYQMLIGDGISIQHSFISHTLIVSGILGFVFYIKRFVHLIQYSIQLIRKSIAVDKVKMLLLAIILILANDFVTNISAYLPFAAYLSALILAFISADIKRNIYYGYKN